MKHLGWIVAAALVMLALAGDPMCPSDVDNNGNVGTTDLLQVLADWRPCLAPRVISMASQNTIGGRYLVRLWGDNRIEFAIGRDGDCTPCPFPLNEWFDLDSPTQPVGATPVTVSINAHQRIWVTYSDGTTFFRRIMGQVCYCKGGGNLETPTEVLPWEGFPRP